MVAPQFLLSLGFVAAFSLATALAPWFQSWAGNRSHASSALTVLLGDSRRLFAKHFYVKADAYFHSGYYPTIFDKAKPSEQLHIAADAGADTDGHAEEAGDFLGKPRDWIDGFSRNFFPVQHRHLGEDADAPCSHDHGPEEVCHHADGDATARPGEEREMLPWLRLAAEMDPQRPETYVVASYWLRTKLDQPGEAERFLREGLRANPGNCEILFELGRVYCESKRDIARARNLWELAAENWRTQEGVKPEANIFLLAQILTQLAKLEEEQQNFPRAIEHLNRLIVFSPNRETLQQRIDELLAKKAAR